MVGHVIVLLVSVVANQVSLGYGAKFLAAKANMVLVVKKSVAVNTIHIVILWMESARNNYIAKLGFLHLNWTTLSICFNKTSC